MKRIARRIEQTRRGLLTVQGTLYPVLLKIKPQCAVASESDRRARFDRLRRTGRKRLESETRDWEQTPAIIARLSAVYTEEML